MDRIFQSIGIVKSPYKTLDETPRAGRDFYDKDQVLSEIVVEEKYQEGLADIRPGDLCQIIFCFHKTKGYQLRVRKHGSGPLTGLFSTHAPMRPNPIGITVVRVRKMERNHLFVTGGDMLDGTPVLDIKSY